MLRIIVSVQQGEKTEIAKRRTVVIYFFGRHLHRATCQAIGNFKLRNYSGYKTPLSS